MCVPNWPSREFGRHLKSYRSTIFCSFEVQNYVALLLLLRCAKDFLSYFRVRREKKVHHSAGFEFPTFNTEVWSITAWVISASLLTHNLTFWDLCDVVTVGCRALRTAAPLNRTKQGEDANDGVEYDTELSKQKWMGPSYKPNTEKTVDCLENEAFMINCPSRLKVPNVRVLFFFRTCPSPFFGIVPI